jgi:hypothetical protein
VTTVPLFKKLGARFTDRPRPDAVFELEPGHLCGLRVSARVRSRRAHFVRPLRPGALSPSFDRPNVAEASAIRRVLEEGMKAMGLGGGTVSLLIPEPCVRIFILTVDALPATQSERDSFIRWRVGKQMPLLPEDLKLAYDVAADSASGKVIVAAAREVVIREYEELFESEGLRVGTVTIPSLSLVNLLGAGLDSNGVLINIEPESLSLLAIMDSEWTLYRHKGVGADLEGDRKAELVAKEVENTVHFLEDKERKKVEQIWVRSASGEDGPQVVSKLEETLPLPVELINYAAPASWDARDKALLAPLMGQIA